MDTFVAKQKRNWMKIGRRAWKLDLILFQVSSYVHHMYSSCAIFINWSSKYKMKAEMALLITEDCKTELNHQLPRQRCPGGSESRGKSTCPRGETSVTAKCDSIPPTSLWFQYSLLIATVPPMPRPVSVSACCHITSWLFQSSALHVPKNMSLLFLGALCDVRAFRVLLFSHLSFLCIL